MKYAAVGKNEEGGSGHGVVSDKRGSIQEKARSRPDDGVQTCFWRRRVPAGSTLFYWTTQGRGKAIRPALLGLGLAKKMRGRLKAVA